MSILTALESIIAPELNYAEQKLESVGSALAAGVTVIFNGFFSSQRLIFTNISAFWQAKHKAALAADASALAAIEQASTATLQEFCAEEAAEFQKEKLAFITLLESSVKQSTTS